MAIEENPEIAAEINRQIGHRAFVLMGTDQKMDLGNGLQFNIKGSKKWNKVWVTLDPSDTYTIQFFKIGRAPKHTVTKSEPIDGVYVDMLREIIESETGLYLTLFPVR